MRRAALLSVLALCLVGCQSTSWNPLRVWFGRKADTVEKQEKREAANEDKAVVSATIESFKTDIALKAAPVSQPVEVARRTNTNALQLLQQRQPLSVLQMQEASDIVAGLLSDEAKARKAAESKQADAEGALAKLSQELTDIRAKLDSARQDAKAEAARNLELANELRAERLWKWGGIALSALLSIAAVAYRLNIGRLQQGAAEVLATLQAKHGDEAASAARGALDAVLNAGEQQAVAKAFFALTRR